MGSSIELRMGWRECMWEQWVYVRLGNSEKEWEEHGARNQEV